MLLEHKPTKADITPPAAPRPDAVQLRARRSPRLMALGILAIVLGALGAAALYTLNTDHVSVVVMARDVTRGNELQAADLKVVDVPSTLGVEMTAASDLGRLLGLPAHNDLPEGSFPLPRHLGRDPIPDGHYLVGIRLGSGRLPDAPLSPGTRIRLVSLLEGDDSVVDAVVALPPTSAEDGSGWLVDVTVPDGEAATVARWAATDQVALIADGEG